MYSFYAAIALAALSVTVACAEAPPSADATPGSKVSEVTAPLAYKNYPYKSHFVTVQSGYQVHYLDEGEGDTPLLLIHGMPTQAYLWREMIPTLSENNRVIALDQPNWGKSDKTPDVRNGVPCAGDYAKWIEEFVDALGVEKVRLVIHDMGFVGFLYAARNPAKVDGIAFFETAIGPFPRELAPPFLEAFLGPEGESLVVDENYMVETLLMNNAYNEAGDPPFRTMHANLTEDEAAVYYEPFKSPENRRAILFDRECLGFIGTKETDPGTDEHKQENLSEFLEFAQYLSTTDTPRLALFGSPGFVLPKDPMEAIITGAAPAEAGGWQNTKTVTTVQIHAPTLHYWQEEDNGAPVEVARAIQHWLDAEF